MSAGAREVGIGVVGYGTMGRAHSYGYAAAPVIRALGCRPRLARHQRAHRGRPWRRRREPAASSAHHRLA